MFKRTVGLMMKKSNESISKISKIFIFTLPFIIPSAFLSAFGYSNIPQNDRSYISVFAGGIFTTSSRASQFGTALRLESEGGPLAVLAVGDVNGSGSFLGGLNGGFEWRSCPYLITSNWGITPAVEVEAFWYNTTKKGQLASNSVGLSSHLFYDKFPMYSGVYLTNFVFSFYNCSDISPYIAVGIGASRINIRNAYSEQIDPAEPNINHFNTDFNETDWTFAAQFKVGLKYKLCDRLHIFGEYRYLFVDFNNYVFGSTKYTGHAVTTPWSVQFENINHNVAVFGIQYDL